MVNLRPACSNRLPFHAVCPLQGPAGTHRNEISPGQGQWLSQAMVSASAIWADQLARRIVTPLAAAGMMAIATVTASPAWSATLVDWKYSPATGALAFELDTTEKPSYFLIANPMRIVMDLPGSYAYPQNIEAQAGGVFTAIRVANTRAGKTRMVLELAPGTVLQPGQVELIALGDGRWSFKPLLADGQPVAREVAAAPMAPTPSAAVIAPVPKSPSRAEVAATLVQEPEVVLPPLEAMEQAAVEADFVSMEETLAQQQARGAVTPPRRVVVPEVAIPLGQYGEATGSIQWGESQLPPVPEFGSAPADGVTADRVTNRPAPTEPPTSSDILPQLPQPRLGQAPFALTAFADQSLVDPAQIVDSRQLRQPGATRPPAAVEPVVDPSLLSLDGEQQSAASLGGSVDQEFSPAPRAATVRSAAQPATVPLPVSTAPTVADDGTPFLVEFGAPLPDLDL